MEPEGPKDTGRVSIISRILFLWAVPLIRKARRLGSKLGVADLPPLGDDGIVPTVSARVKRYWASEVAKADARRERGGPPHEASLVRTIWRSYGSCRLVIFLGAAWYRPAPPAAPSARCPVSPPPRRRRAVYHRRRRCAAIQIGLAQVIRMLIRAIERDDDLWVGFTLLGVIVLMVGASSISQQNGLFEAQVSTHIAA